MIETLYGTDALAGPRAFILAWLIGVGFGFALERAGFGSSRRLAGVFYFRDMAVVKVMFSGLITALLALSYLLALGWIRLDQIFLMPTLYGAQVIGGLLFGVGFAMGSWCPGTAASGLAAGRIDALVFLVGVVGGSILFNEVFPLIRTLYTAGDRGTQMIYEVMGMSRNVFILLFTLVAVAVFWGVEWVEKIRLGRAPQWNSPFLKAFSLALVALAMGLFILSPVSLKASEDESASPSPSLVEKALMGSVEAAEDHIEPEELADRLMSGEAGLVVVDVRPAAEFEVFHIRGALNIALDQLADALQPYKSKGWIVLYSNGMTHPAQARDSLQRQGFDNVRMLTDGLQGFRDRCLKPASLRSEPLSVSLVARINAWRAFFTGGPEAVQAVVPAVKQGAMPRVVDTQWMASRLGDPGLVIIDFRPQPEYNHAHIPGSLSLNVESLRGNIRGVPSMLLPAPLLAAQFSLLGLMPEQTVVLVAGEKPHDATLAGMALERLGHMDYAILEGGYPQWSRAGLPTDASIPSVQESVYPASSGMDQFSADFQTVAAKMNGPGHVIIDVRPADYYTGKKSDEARAGHIPGAVNRPYTEDIVAGPDNVLTFKPLEVLSSAYDGIIPSKDTEVIVHCRTGHQASQTFFVLKHMLGYPHVLWYDAGWTEWAARQELPIVNETQTSR